MIGAEALTIRKPDDFHVHLRDGATLRAVAPLTAGQFARALVMPNLRPPVRTAADAAAYHARIVAAVGGAPFEPLMSLYLTDATSAADVREAAAAGLVKACKLYPAGATTNSALGVTSMDRVKPALAAMEEVGLVLCVHGEATGADVDIFDKEAEYLRTVLPPILRDYPRLKIVLEHVTTAEAAALVTSTPGNRLAATITAHHLLYSRGAIFEGAKIHPHMFCLPILKRETHRQALLKAIADDDRGCFFAGTDSAPHSRDSKICPEGCAGIFTGATAVELYAEAFEKAGALGKLSAFLGENGANFYGLPLNSGTMQLTKQAAKVPVNIAVEGAEPIIPLRSGQTVSWQIVKQ